MAGGGRLGPAARGLLVGSWPETRAGNREDAVVFPGVFVALGLPHCLLETAVRFRVRDFRGVRSC